MVGVLGALCFQPSLLSRYEPYQRGWKTCVAGNTTAQILSSMNLLQLKRLGKKLSWSAQTATEAHHERRRAVYERIWVFVQAVRS